MNRAIETTLMISAGAVLTASAQWRPMLGDLLHNVIELPATAAAEVAPVLVQNADDFDRQIGVRVIPCQDTSSVTTTSNSASITTHDERGGFKVSIADGKLKKIEAHGEYTLEEEGDTVRILDPDGEVAFETSKSNPTIGDAGFAFHSFDRAFAPAVPGARATLGVKVTPADEAMLAQLDIECGVVAEFITPGSGADAAGLQQFDVLIAIDGEPLGAKTLADSLSIHEPGETVSVELIRTGQRQTIEVVLDASPALAPAFNAFNFGSDDAIELEALHRMLESQLHGHIRAPRRVVIPHWAPLLRAPTQPKAAPAPEKKKPGAIDASEMAPKARTRSVPA